ncbi:MAG: class I SAM-dependent methyltransferase [Gemmatimonadaceae bacterium]
MDAGYLGAYRDLYLRHWWWRSREALLVREIERLSPPGGFGRILDVGCGDGLFFPALQRFGHPYGIEPAAEALTPDGPWRPRIHAGPLDASFQPGHRFGLVLALDVIEHLADPDAFLEHVRRLVEPGGWFVATVPAFRALWTAHDDLNQHVTRYRRDELASLVAAHGLDVVHARYFFVLLAGAKLLVRALERIRRSPPGAPGVPAGPVNAALEFTCRAEQAVLGRHAPWFGSSLLLVARAPR